MIITSDYGGFAGVRPPNTQPAPASIRSSELMFRRRSYLRQGHSSSEVGPRKKTSAAALVFQGSILPVFVFDDEIVIVVDLVPLGLLVVQVFQGVVDPVWVVLPELL